MISPEMTKVAVVGAGLIGASWAVVFARAGLNVSVHDADVSQLHRAEAAIRSALNDLREAGLLSDSVQSVFARIQFFESLAPALRGVQYAQESITEVLVAKREIFAAMDEVADPNTILASSTSAFVTSSFAAEASGRARCLVAHPVNPPHLVPFVEVSGAPFTSENVVADTMALMRQVRQSPIHVRQEIRGFVLNRLQWTLLVEAYRLFSENVASADDIDRAVRDGLGRRWAFMGPFEVGDLNAPEGIADYLQRFGPTIEAISASRAGQSFSLDPAVTAKLQHELRSTHPQSARAEHLAQRDKRQLALVASTLCDREPRSENDQIPKAPDLVELPGN